MAAEARLPGLGRAGLAVWLLAAACTWAALLWAGALLGMGGKIEQALPVPAGSLPVPAAATPDRIGPLAQYASAAARPLFTQDRRPRSFLATGPEQGADAVQAERFDFVLSGVVISPRVRLAILQPSAGGESQRVPLGQSPEGAGSWRLVDLQPRRAVFEGSSGQAVLDLRTFGVAGGPVAAQGGDAVTAVANAGGAAAPAPMVAPPPPPPPPDSQDAQTTEARIDAIRRRIEARRAQLQNRNTTAPPPSSGPARQ